MSFMSLVSSQVLRQSPTFVALSCLPHSRRSLHAIAAHQGALGVAKKVGVIGVPIDMGAGRRGVDMGPSAVRLAKINTRISELGYDVIDHGNISVTQKEERDIHDENARYWPYIEQVVTDLARQTEAMYTAGQFPLTLGGDHCVGAGSMAGVQRARKKLGLPPMGLLWFDAHTDMNTPETTPSGNLHGMPVAALLGMQVKGLSSCVGQDALFDPKRVAFIGIRDVDANESRNLADMGLTPGKNIFTMREIDELGMAEVMRRALYQVAPARGPFALSLDIDALDPEEAPGVGTPVPGGISYREAHLAMEIISDHGNLQAMDLVEVNPILDKQNQTARLGVELICSVLGKSILATQRDLTR
eukprot:CAMPEP_0177651134 /NCGR_PEP_ID=MMETSP0447-20121125/12357_1 /TAXON_ID=0 /ORGANISM="Stygamoeba regulata, Strain BSH-02190019" /LENGTH=358 /DNA_ID=CAMNT_0019154137 /DNA_START=131 /DNA_END=1207 /DNA_ORIENTATION=-